MKTLNKVIKTLIKCSEDFCKECPYNGENNCAVLMKQDAFQYLDSYRPYKRGQRAKMNIYDDAAYNQYEQRPLTWDELKQMEGKPVWVEYNLHLDSKEYQDKSRTWDIIDHFGICMDNIVMFTEKGFIFGKEVQGIQWRAYRKERE